ncbi:DUF4097 family beta strand repeat-containing protein [Spirosoma rhododendri]|uniref:DUF4097 family beta strand repeat protein n=1 Tax=Spirosoma rhododendri TaxID=2728024 RepID=A0A7L5DIM6_9BACT|nr:DUF4097 family beta strand repeat-containing protein [Spirosoma rhododendri]QJD78239.1 DUF4097 family beta strand repeat protein [Spirosoma rhododendri]
MKILYSVLLVALPLLARAEDPWADMVERKKTIIKSYDVSANDVLTVDNQFGQVSVGLWDKPEIRVEIAVMAGASTEAKAQSYLDAVEIEDKRAGNQIAVKTHFGQSSISNWNFNGWRKNGDRNYVKINYTVTMPRRNALSIRNKFGNTSIPTFHAPLTVHSRYGNFSADDLTNNDTDLDIAYGKADIRTVDQAKLEVAYADLELSKANILTLVNKFGKTRIGDVGKLNADIDYSGAQIGTLRESGKIRLSFSGGFRIEQLPKTADNVNIESSYSSVALPIANSGDCDFNVTVSYGNFNYTSSPAMHFSLQPDDSNNRGPKLTKQYVGKVGAGTGTKVKVVSRFGNVSFK